MSCMDHIICEDTDGQRSENVDGNISRMQLVEILHTLRRTKYLVLRTQKPL